MTGMTRSPRYLLVSALAALAAVAALSCSGSKSDTPTPSLTPTPTATLIVPVTPTADATPTVGLHPTQPPTPAVTDTPMPGSTPTPGSTATPEGLNASEDSSVDFPNSVTFSLDATSDKPVQNVELRFTYPLVYSCTQDSYSSVRIEPDDPNKISASWDWEMQKTGSVPPGTHISYSWVIHYQDGSSYQTSSSETLWDDTRFTWQTYTSGNITFHWYDGSASFGQTLATSVQNRLDRMKLGVTLDKPIDAYIYPDADTLRGAILYTQAWVGGLAFTSQNILLIAVGPTAPSEQVDGLVHEMTHLLVREVTFSCIGDMPTWLDEGLAMYGEGPVTAKEQTALDDAVASGKLITLRSLSSSFPADDSGASLAYTESKSLVSYLIDVLGWDKMNQMLNVFEQGSAYEDAVQQVYGMDLLGLESAWKTWLATQ